jgi:hypothetical protein
VTKAIPGFAAFPRRPLTLRWHRRQMLTSLATELRVRSQRRDGGNDMKIADLGTLPDEILELMTPILAPHYAAEQFGPAFSAVIERMDGRSTLREIAGRLAAETGWNADHAFAFTRGVFLHLVSEGNCLPRG